jgi:intein/homing endonuclease
LPERGGLEPADVTVIGNDLSRKDYVEIEFEDGKKLCFASDAEFLVDRDGKEVTVLADELTPDDDVIFDRKDELFTIPEL